MNDIFPEQSFIHYKSKIRFFLVLTELYRPQRTVLSV